MIRRPFHPIEAMTPARAQGAMAEPAVKDVLFAH
jgi:hypothetical protein